MKAPELAASTCLACGAEVVVAAHNIAGYVSVFDPHPHAAGQVEIDFDRGRWKSLTPAQAKREATPDERRYRFHRCGTQT